MEKQMSLRKLIFPILSVVLISTGCRPLCLVGPPNDTASRTLWFGQKTDLAGDYAWERKQPYKNSTIYIEPVDLSSLKNCDGCTNLATRLDGYYKIEWIRGFSGKVKSMRVVNGKDDAELVGSIKIAGVKEIRSFWKLPLGFIHNSDKFIIWFKIINKSTGELVFAAQRPDFISNGNDVSLEGEYFAKLVDDFDHQKSK